MPFARLNGHQVHYSVTGQGDPLVLLHHGFASSGMWEELLPGLVGAGHMVITYDRRGYGQSEDGEDFPGFYKRTEEFTQAAVAELADLHRHLDLGPVHLLGQCEGGVVAVRFAVEHPELARSVMTGSTQCFATEPVMELSLRVFHQGWESLDPKIKAKMVSWHGQAGVAEKFELFRIFGGTYGTGMFDLRPWLRRVLCPALVVYPDRSALFPVEQAVEFYRQLPRGELAVIPACGHNTYEYRPQEYQRLVLDFLERHRQGGVASLPGLGATCMA